MADDEDLEIVRKLRSLTSRIWSHIGQQSILCRDASMSDITIASLAGGVTFPLCLGSLQAVVFGPLRVTSNRTVLAPVCGFFSVFVSGSAASGIFASSIAVSSGLEDFFKTNKETNAATTSRKYPLKFGPVHVPLCGALSLVVFKLLGGRFSSLLPSNLAYPGAFARSSVPASGQNYASQAVKQQLTQIGKRYGCHSCGRKWRTAFVGDHMPPNKLVKKNQKQHFYPQCSSCSNKQGGALSGMSEHRLVKTHGTSLRLYHLWLPVPALLILMKKHRRDIHDTADITPEYNRLTEDSSLVHDILSIMKVRKRTRADHRSEDD